MRRSLLASSAAASALVSLLCVTTATAQGCSMPGGARYVTSADYNHGLRSDIDFEAHSPPSGKTLIRQLQIRNPDSDRSSAGVPTRAPHGRAVPLIPVVGTCIST